MTLEEIKKQIDVARAAPMKDGTSEWFDLLPRVYYNELPPVLRAEADKITVDAARRGLYECYPVGAIDEYAADERAFKEKILHALHTARYTVKGTDVVGNAGIDNQLVSLYAADLIEAWERIAGNDILKALPRIMATNVVKVIYPLDKINNTVWGLLADADPNGQITLNIDVAAAKNKKRGEQACVYYSLNFSEIEDVKINKSLNAYDKRVYIATSALFCGGSEVITSSQIYKAMGYTGSPASSDIAKINDSITKMSNAQITIDNVDVLDRHERNVAEKSLYKEQTTFQYEGKLLPMEKINARYRGQTVESAIHLFREPPLTTFAKERKQITTIDRVLLETPLSKTAANIALEDYLIERIARLKNGTASNKLLYETIYKETGVKTKMQRSRIKEKIEKILKHYKENGFICAYSDSGDGIIISY